MAFYKVASLFGTYVAETILASVHVRAHQQAGHMDASDLIKALQKKLARRGPSTYAQKKNIEALTEANQLVIAGVQAVMKRQAEILQGSMEQARTVASEIMVPGVPEAKLAKQAEVVQTAFQGALANMKELADMVTKSNTEAANVITKRVSESLDEVKAAVVKVAKK